MLQSIANLFEDRPKTFVLDNGLEVIHQQNSDHPLVSVQAWIKTGSIHEQDQLGSGLSHFLEHMLFKGTGKRKSGQIAADVQAFGGEVNAYTSFDRTVYYIDGPAESLENILDILSDQTLNASLPWEEVEKEREVILREIDMTLDDPDRRVSRALFSLAFRESPLQHPVIGIRSLFERVTRDNLVHYYSERYQPNNMVLVVCGDFDPDRLQDQVETTFGNYPRGCLRPVMVANEPGQLARRESRLFGDFGIVRGLMAFKSQSLRHHNAPALDLLAAILGSGHSGRFRQHLREELELVHGASASIWNPYDPGLFIFQYQADPDKAHAAEAAIEAFLKEIAESGFTHEDLEKARRFAVVSEIHSRKTVSGLAGRLGVLATIIGDLDYPKRYFQSIQDVSLEQLRELAASLFDQHTMSLSVLCPDSMQATGKRTSNTQSTSNFEEKQFANGARLFWQVDRKLPRTWLRFAACGGPSHERASQRGVTNLMATLLNRDTKSRSARQIAQDLESRGGFMMESAGSNTFSLALEVMPEDQAHGVALMNDALANPAFLEKTLEREKACQVALIKEIQDDILDYGRMRLRHHFFGQHPFASHPYGSVESVENLSRNAVAGIHGSLLRGQNAVMVAAGDFDEAEILPRMESFLSALPDGAPEKCLDIPFLPAASGIIHEHMDRQQSVVFQAYPDVGICHEHHMVAQLLDEILSDMSGALFKSVREDQSLAYFVGAARMLAPELGCFYLYAGTHPDSSERVLQSFENEILRLRCGEITPEEIESARTRLCVANRFSLQTPSNRATKLSLNALFGRPPMAWLDYEERLGAVTKDDLVQFAVEHFDPDKCLRLVITPN